MVFLIKPDPNPATLLCPIPASPPLMIERFVEEFHMSDVERELGLTREGLVTLALLLGSDYTEGCQGGWAV